MDDSEIRYKKPKFVLANLNVQSLNKKIDIFTHFLADNKVDACCITEHWSDEGRLSCINLGDHDIVHSFCRHDCRYGGAAIVLRRGIKFLKMTSVRTLSVENHVEMVAVRIPAQKLIIMSIYRPPRGDFGRFISQLSMALAVVTEGVNSASRVFIAGDFNVNFLIDGDGRCDELTGLFSSFGLKQIFKEASRIAGQTQTCIDNVFTDLEADVYRGLTFDPFISDHRAQLVHLFQGSPKIIEKEELIPKRNINERNINKFKSMLLDVDWSSVKLDTAEKSYERFHTIVQDCFDSAFPVERCKSRPKMPTYRKMGRHSAGLKKAVQAAQTIHWVKKSTESANLLSVLKKHFRQSFTEDKKSLNERLILNSNDKTKTIWDIIIAESGKMKKHPSQLSELTAENMGDFFSTIGEKISAQCSSSCDESTEMTKKLRTDRVLRAETMFMYPTTHEELIDTTKKLKSKPTQDLYGMSTIILKEVIHIVAEPLSGIFNMCMLEGTFPKELKVAKVLPIHKKGDIYDCNNFRPIAILPTFSKLFEFILKERLMSFLGSSLNPHQHGFRKKKSTTTALTDLLEGIAQAFEDYDSCELLAVDLSKAFDSVRKDILIAKLEHYGVRGVSSKLFESYLTDRLQVVEWKGITSEAKTINIGVPQGSILGPLLFLVYINDLPENVSSTRSILYADDTTFMNSAPTEGELDELSVTTLDMAENWFGANGLKLNKDKTQRIKFRTESDESTVCLLGIYIDAELKWGEHLKFLKNKLSTAIFTIRRIREVASREISKLTYYSNFHPVATYGILLWGYGPGLQQVLLKQKEAIRAICGVPTTTSCRELFGQLGILTVTSVFILTCLKYVHNNRSRFPTNGHYHNYMTRARDHFSIEHHRLKRTQMGINYTCLKLYNSIPRRLKDAPENLFHKEMKKILLSRTFYTVDEFLIHMISL